MPLRSRAFATGLLALVPAGLLPAARAAFAGPAVPTPVLEVRDVHAGDRVKIRWRALPRSVEEFEILLSIDGGRTFALRVSPEIEGCEDAYVWTVPNVSAMDARIRIRARIDEREVEGPPGPSFTIVADFDKPREAWLFRERGEPEPAEHAAPPWSFASGRERPELHAIDAMIAIEVPARGLPMTRSARAVEVVAEDGAARPSGTGNPRSVAARFRPLRN